MTLDVLSSFDRSYIRRDVVALYLLSERQEDDATPPPPPPWNMIGGRRMVVCHEPTYVEIVNYERFLLLQYVALTIIVINQFHIVDEIAAF